MINFVWMENDYFTILIIGSSILPMIRIKCSRLNPRLNQNNFYPDPLDCTKTFYLAIYVNKMPDIRHKKKLENFWKLVNQMAMSH